MKSQRKPGRWPWLCKHGATGSAQGHWSSWRVSTSWGWSESQGWWYLTWKAPTHLPWNCHQSTGANSIGWLINSIQIHPNQSPELCFVLFTHKVLSDSLQPHRLQHARFPCPSPSPRVCSNSCPLSQWCHPTISSSVTRFSSCPQSFPSWGSFPISHFFASGGQSIEASVSVSVLPMNIQDWFPLGLTGLISLLKSLKSLLQHHSSYAVATAAAKSLQSCPTLCDLIDSSPPGSPIPGIFQARTLEWVAIFFSSAWKWKVKVKSLSRVQLLATPWTVAHQAPPSMGFSRQEYWSGVSLPSPVLINGYNF